MFDQITNGLQKMGGRTDDGVDSDAEDGDGISVEVETIGTYGRRIRSKVAVQGSLQTMWAVLTDYERLADFIPGLAVSQLVEKGDKFARVFQVGKQKLVFGWKFNTKAIIGCFEKDLQILPSGQKREIEFKMIEGDLRLFEGKWSVVEQKNAGYLESDSYISRKSQTTLIYTVDAE